MEEQRPVEPQLGRIHTGSSSTENWKSLGLALSLSLNVVFDPLRRRPSEILTGGYLKQYEEMLVRAPPTPRSRPSLTARITSETTPALLGESSTESLRSIWSGMFPHFLPLM